MKKGVLIAFYVILVLVVAAVIVFIVRMTNGFTDEFKSFYITDTNNKVYATVDKAVLPRDKDTQFNVHYTFDKITDISTDYTVKVVTKSSDNTKFGYTVDGENFEYVSDKDVTSLFGIVKSENSFTLKMPGDMQTVLNALHKEQTVQVPDGINIAGEAYFELVVTSYNGKSSIIISLYAETANVSDIKLNTNNIVFR